VTGNECCSRCAVLFRFHDHLQEGVDGRSGMRDAAASEAYGFAAGAFTIRGTIDIQQRQADPLLRRRQGLADSRAAWMMGRYDQGRWSGADRAALWTGAYGTCHQVMTGGKKTAVLSPRSLPNMPVITRERTTMSPEVLLMSQKHGHACRAKTAEIFAEEGR